MGRLYNGEEEEDDEEAVADEAVDEEEETVGEEFEDSFLNSFSHCSTKEAHISLACFERFITIGASCDGGKTRGFISDSKYRIRDVSTSSVFGVSKDSPKN